MDISIGLINGISIGVEHLTFDEYVEDEFPDWMIVVHLVIFRLTFSKYSD